eukprot:2209189-Heterocapsa_arctica.AAC.1
MEDHPAWQHRSTGRTSAASPSSMPIRANARPPVSAGEAVPRGSAMGSADLPYGTADNYSGTEQA